MEHNRIIVYDFAALFIVCCLYALVVHRARPWYVRENKTWFMLVVGVVIVLAAIGALIPAGIVDLHQWGLFVLAFCVGGAPMVVGQLIQDAIDHGRRDAARRNHDENTRR
jgi:uncharacterized membrane protein